MNPMSELTLAAPLNICLVTEELSSVGASGGIGGAFYELAVALAPHHHVDILYCPIETPSSDEQERIRERFRRRGIDLRFLKPGSNTWDWSSVEARSYEVFRDLSECGVNYDVIHFHEYKGLGFFSIAARNQGIAFASARMVVQLHGPTRWTMEANDTLFTHPDQIKIDHMERECIRSADYAVSPSSYLLSWLRGNNWELPPENRCLVIKNVCTGLKDLPAVRHAARRPHAARLEEVREIIMFGRHEYRKGFSVFCDALDLLRDKLEERQTRVTFLGRFGMIADEPSGLVLARRGRKWRFPIAVLPGHNRDQATTYLAQAADSVVVVPSWIENSPYTVLETIALRRPIITSNDGGAAELLAPDTHAEMTCPITAQSLADAIERALDDGIAFPELAEPLESTETRWLEFHEDLAAPRPVIKISDEDPPLVTVGITHFERPAKLVEAITSIARQTYENIELIVVDDGSSSTATVEALEAIEVMIRRLGGTLIRRENGYLGAARNTVAAAAKGQYLCFLDDDDIALPEMVATLVKAATNSHSELVNCLNISMPESRRAEAWPVPDSFRNKISYLPIGGPLSLAPIQNCLGAATALISRKCFDTVGGYTELRGVGHEDYEFFARALQAGFHLDVCPLPLYLYEVDRPSMISSTSSNRNYKRVADALDISKNSKIWHDLLSMNSGRTATEWGENRRNYLISIDKNAELLQQIVTEHDLQKLLLLLADYASAIGSNGMGHVYQLSHAHYQRMEEGSASDEEKMMAMHQIFQSANSAQPKHGTSGLSDVRVDILLGRPDKAADRIVQRIRTQGYLDSEDVANLQTLLLEPISPGKAAELSDVVCSSSVPQSEVGRALLAVFLMAIKIGNESKIRDAFKKVIEFDEGLYLEQNSDIVKAVSENYFTSGWQHFFHHGKKEGRNGYENTLAAYHSFVTITKSDQSLENFVDYFRGADFDPIDSNVEIASF